MPVTIKLLVFEIKAFSIFDAPETPIKTTSELASDLPLVVKDDFLRFFLRHYGLNGLYEILVEPHKKGIIFGKNLIDDLEYYIDKLKKTPDFRTLLGYKYVITDLIGFLSLCKTYPDGILKYKFE